MKKNGVAKTGGKATDKPTAKPTAAAAIATKRPRGRPPFPAGQVRDGEITIRVTAGETQQLAAWARGEGKTLTGFVRTRCGLGE